MPRYIRQRDGHSCGPHCCMNILKFQGEQVTQRGDLAAWKDMLNCGITYSSNHYNRKDWRRGKTGTSIGRFNRVIKELGGKRFLAPNMRKMHRKLEQGFALAVQVRYTSIHGHLFLITKTRKNAFYCVNLFQGVTASWVSKKKFYRTQRKHTSQFRCWAVPDTLCL